jgi:hypothetical protein
MSMKMQILNYTGHIFRIRVGVNMIELASKGNARVVTTQAYSGSFRLNGHTIKVYDVTETQVVDLPEPKPNVAYIVSWPVAKFLHEHSDRTDILVGRFPIVEAGRTKAVLGLAQLK